MDKDVDFRIIGLAQTFLGSTRIILVVDQAKQGHILTLTVWN